MTEVNGMPDIMGDLRPEVESFYKRDEVGLTPNANLEENTILTRNG